MSKTGFFCVVVMIVLAIYDAYAEATGGIDSTISKFLQQTGFRHPSFIFACGYLAGHFFSSMSTK